MNQPQTEAGKALLHRPLIHTTYCAVKHGKAYRECICGVPEAARAIEAQAIESFLASEDAVKGLTQWLNGDDAGIPSADFRAGLIKGGRPFATAILRALTAWSAARKENHDSP